MGKNVVYSFTKITVMFLDINVTENQRGNQEWTLQRHWQHWVHKPQKQDKQNKQ